MLIYGTSCRLLGPRRPYAAPWHMVCMTGSITGLVSRFARKEAEQGGWGGIISIISIFVIIEGRQGRSLQGHSLPGNIIQAHLVQGNGLQGAQRSDNPPQCCRADSLAAS